MRNIFSLLLAVGLLFGFGRFTYASSPGLLVDELGFVGVLEGGASDIYTVALTTAPANDVRILLSAPANQLVVSPTVLTFTATTWSTPQTITVEAFDDMLYEQAHTATIALAVQSADAAYNGKTATVVVQITDNDASGGSGGVDRQPPDLPASISLSTDGKKVTITWKDPVMPDFRLVEIMRNDGNGAPVNAGNPSPVAKGEQQYIDTSVVSGATYVYQLRAKDASNNAVLSKEYTIKIESPLPVAAPTPTAQPPVTPAPTTHTPSPVIVTPVPVDAMDQPLMISDAKEFGVTLNSEQATAAANFYALGNNRGITPAYAVKLGAGERRALLRDYFDTTGYAAVDWDDMSRLASGQKPLGRNLSKEQAQAKVALAMWLKVKGRSPNFKDAAEDLAWNTLMYRIRFPRDLNKEKAGITKFRATMKRAPATPMDWAMVRALGYVL